MTGLGLPPREIGLVTVSRCDNMAACVVSRSRLSTTPTMALCVTILCELEAEFQVRIIFDHIPGEVNVVPDHLSRGKIREAVATMQQAGITNPQPSSLR